MREVNDSNCKETRRRSCARREATMHNVNTETQDRAERLWG